MVPLRVVLAVRVVHEVEPPQDHCAGPTVNGLADPNERSEVVLELDRCAVEPQSHTFSPDAECTAPPVSSAKEAHDTTHTVCRSAGSAAAPGRAAIAAASHKIQYQSRPTSSPTLGRRLGSPPARRGVCRQPLPAPAAGAQGVAAAVQGGGVAAAVQQAAAPPRRRSSVSSRMPNCHVIHQSKRPGG